MDIRQIHVGDGLLFPEYKQFVMDEENVEL